MKSIDNHIPSPTRCHAQSRAQSHGRTRNRTRNRTLNGIRNSTRCRTRSNTRCCGAIARAIAHAVTQSHVQYHAQSRTRTRNRTSTRNGIRNSTRSRAITRAIAYGINGRSRNHTCNRYRAIAREDTFMAWPNPFLPYHTQPHLHGRQRPIPSYRTTPTHTPLARVPRAPVAIADSILHLLLTQLSIASQRSCSFLACLLLGFGPITIVDGITESVHLLLMQSLMAYQRHCSLITFG